MWLPGWEKRTALRSLQILFWESAVPAIVLFSPVRRSSCSWTSVTVGLRVDHHSHASCGGVDAMDNFSGWVWFPSPISRTTSLDGSSLELLLVTHSLQEAKYRHLKFTCNIIYASPPWGHSFDGTWLQTGLPAKGARTLPQGRRSHFQCSAASLSR